MIPCQNAFDRWATDDPERLLDFVADHSRASHLLTFAAETLGRSEAPADKTETALVAALKHPHPSVREGALLGLNELSCRARLQPETLAVVERIAADDTSPGVRAVSNGLAADWRAREPMP